VLCVDFIVVTATVAIGQWYCTHKGQILEFHNFSLSFNLRFPVIIASKLS